MLISDTPTKPIDKITVEMQQDVHRWATEALKALGYSDFPLDIGWGARFTASMGQAHCKENRVRFSVPLWPIATDDERRHTAMHEVCHIIVHHESQKAIRVKPHGDEWKRAMRRCGLEPERNHNVGGITHKRTQRSVEANCGCGKHMITKRRLKKMQEGILFTCRRCRQDLWVGEKPEDHRGTRPKKTRRRSGRLEDILGEILG